MHHPVVDEKLEMLSRSSTNFRSDETKTENVKVITLDKFCAEQNIERINYLKIDTCDTAHSASCVTSIYVRYADMLLHRNC